METVQISTFGALIGLIVAIVLILKKAPPLYGMLVGALLGGLLGGAGLPETITLMIKGAEGITAAVMRILAAGILAGVLIESGAAIVIAESIIIKVGEKHVLLALIIATMILTAAGTLADVSVIIVAPIGLALAHRMDFSRMAVLFAIAGGSKAGNVISPNPNTIAAADALNVPLTSVMLAGLIPCIAALATTYFLSTRLKHKGSRVMAFEIAEINRDTLPNLGAALTAPVVTICLLFGGQVTHYQIDPFIALPLGGTVGLMAMKKMSSFNDFVIKGLDKLSGVAIMILGTGALAGIIGSSGLKDSLVAVLSGWGLPPFILAPISGVLMSLATASTTGAAAVASKVFGDTIVELGVGSLAAAAMIHAGATVFDQLPHGSFFHSTRACVNMGMKERLKLMPYEFLIGISLTLTSTFIYGIF